MTHHSTTILTPDRLATPLRENVAVRDITDCLIEAYDCVARLACEKFVARGAQAGGELDDWLTAEHELLDNLPADLQDSGEFITALVSVPGVHASQINIGIESRWLVIVSRREYDGENDRSREADGDGDEGAPENGTEGRAGKNYESRCDSDAEKVAEFSRAVHGYWKSKQNGAVPIASSSELHASRRTLEVNVLGGQPLRGQPLSNEPICGDTLSGQPSCGKPSKPLPQLFAILELPAEVDASQSVAVLAGGLLGLRMPKKLALSH